jgi:Arf-GAP domain and FG repeats-containing protein 1
MADAPGERRVRALRDTQKRHENKRCADCTERLPNYVVSDFNTFVCTACSGLHRELSHRIKSVSLSSFTDDEVRAVRKGGNRVANDLWLAK